MTGEKVLSLFMIAAFLFLSGCDRKEDYEKPLKAVRVATVTVQDGGEASRYSASIIPCRQVTLSFRVGGYVEEILKGPPGTENRILQEGDTVLSNEILARIRETEYAARVNQARAGLSEASSALSKAREDLNRAVNLFRETSMTRADYDGIRTRFEVAQSQVRGAKAVVEEAETVLRDCRLKAPMDGVILKRLIEVGSLIGPGSPAFILADISSVKAVFGVPDMVVENLKAGSPQRITTEAFPGETFEGKITTISPSADPMRRVFEVEITIPNDSKRLRAGMISSLEMDTAKATPPLPAVPLNAIVRPRNDLSGYAVFLIDREADAAVARLRIVRPGNILGNNVAILEGLKEGDEIVTAGAPLLIDGEKVSIIP